MNASPYRSTVPRSCRRSGGVALVATLIMLSLVTFMVVAFLGVARRERRQLEVVTNMDAARMANEAGRSRAIAEVLARLLATGDKYNYGVMVSTNFQSPGFNPLVASPNNVNHTNALALPGQPTPWLANLANLQYDPRLPVFSPYYANVTPYDPLASETNQGRWYLDFNHGGMFDYTDRFQAGDPHWIGMLEYPDAPHSANNRGIARYAYLVMPAGKALDLNLIHNQAKLPASVTAEGYLRNLGLGPHEMNLAAMLAEANPFWNYNYVVGAGPSGGGAFSDARDLLLFRNNGGYNNQASLNTAFGAAAGNLVGVAGPQFDVLGNGPLMISTNLSVDTTDAVASSWAGGSNTSTLAQRYFDMNEIFVPSRTYSSSFTSNLLYLSTTNETIATAVGERNRRTLYTLLSTLGTDSWPVNGKLNINWSNAVYNPTSIQIGSSGGELSGFASWDPNYFFFNAAELMIRASCTPVVYYDSTLNPTNWLATNWFFGTSYANITNLPASALPTFVPNRGITLSVTNIPIHPYSYYSGEMHRILQLAANIYDATTKNNGSPAYPTLFRPLFSFVTNGWPSNDFVYISGYTTNQTDTALLGLPMFDLSDPNGRLAMYTNAGAVVAATGKGNHPTCLIAGTPVIVGARRGYPNFNEFGMQTIFSDTRRLEFVKTNATNFGPNAIVMTNQSIIIGLTNIYGFEAWNSYYTAFPRDLRLVATNVAYVVLTNEFGPVYTNISTNGTNLLITANTWKGTSNGLASFKGFFFTNVPQLSTNLARGYGYSTNYPPLTGFTNGGFIPASPAGPGSPSWFSRSNGFPAMHLGITITNVFTYALYEPASNRVVDFVTLTNLITGVNLSTALITTNSQNPNADPGVNFWLTNRLGAGSLAPTLGISNQIALSLNTNISAGSSNYAVWRQYSLTTPVLREIDRFRRFLGTNTALPINQVPSPASSIQAPFTPTRLIVFNTSWEANDPLVHYTTRDLTDPFRTTISDQILPVPFGSPIAPPGTLFRVDYDPVKAQYYTNQPINRYYLPWGRPLSTFGTSLANYTNSNGSITNFYLVAPAAYDQRLKDAGIYSSDAWDFPQRKFANLGWLGRVHRGTPWQTVYLKSDVPNPTNWFYWAHSADTNPTNDWRLMDVFSTAINADATRSLLSVNQTNSVAWAAALGGVLVLSNNGVGIVPMTITPQTPQLSYLVGGQTNGIIKAKQAIPAWQPVANYSQGDVVSYFNGPYGFVNYYMATTSTNQNQNPFVQVSVSNQFGYWTNVNTWSAATTYGAGDVVAYYGVSYYSTQPGNNNRTPDQNTDWWEPYQYRSFTRLGQILSTPELSVQSPYLNGGQLWQINTAYPAGARVYWQGWYYQATRPVPANTPPYPLADFANARTLNTIYGIWWPLESPVLARQVPESLTDVFIERIPQQTLGLLQLETSPRAKIYTWGQALRPADRGIYVGGAPYQGMVTNYQITGESATLTLVRIDGLPEPGLLPRPIPPGAPPQVLPRVIVESHKQVPAAP